jgi:hypothetical protein
MSKEHKEIKKITAGSIFSWIFGVLFLFAGMGLIAQSSYVTGILVMVCSAMIIPYFNKISAEKFHFEISGGLKFVLVMVIFILMGIGMSNSVSNVDVQPTDNVINQQNTQTQPTQNTQTTTKQKVKSATLTLDRVVETAANLDKIRLTIVNTGDVSIRPKFDVVVTDSRDNVVCEGSPMFGVGSISSKETKTDEIQLLICIFEKDGDYEVKVDLLDEDFTKLDTASKTLKVNYWGKFSFG